MDPQTIVDEFNEERLLQIANGNYGALHSSDYGTPQEFLQFKPRDKAPYTFDTITMTSEGARRWRTRVRATLPISREIPPQYDDLIFRSTIVHRFSRAIANVNDAMDKADNHIHADGEVVEFDASHEFQLFRSGKVNTADIEAAAWQILEIVIDLHRNGLRRDPENLPYLKGRRKGRDPDGLLTIEERVDKIEILLKNSKLVWGDILRSGEQAIWALVRCPQGIARRKKSNQHSNRQRARNYRDSPDHRRKREEQARRLEALGHGPQDPDKMRAYGGNRSSLAKSATKRNAEQVAIAQQNANKKQKVANTQEGDQDEEIHEGGEQNDSGYEGALEGEEEYDEETETYEPGDAGEAHRQFEEIYPNEEGGEVNTVEDGEGGGTSEEVEEDIASNDEDPEDSDYVD